MVPDWPAHSGMQTTTLLFSGPQYPLDERMRPVTGSIHRRKNGSQFMFLAKLDSDPEHLPLVKSIGHRWEGSSPGPNIIIEPSTPRHAMGLASIAEKTTSDPRMRRF